MPDFILTTGDKALFTPSFGQATVVPQPGNLIGTGTDKINGKPVCIDGDEKKVLVPGCTYMTPQYTIPGVGMLSISGLAANQKAKKTKSGGQPVLLKGASFQAKFQVMVPAQQPTPTGPVPDATPQYSGSGTFITTNLIVKGS